MDEQATTTPTLQFRSTFGVLEAMYFAGLLALGAGSAWVFGPGPALMVVGSVLIATAVMQSLVTDWLASKP